LRFPPLQESKFRSESHNRDRDYQSSNFLLTLRISSQFWFARSGGKSNSTSGIRLKKQQSPYAAPPENRINKNAKALREACTRTLVITKHSLGCLLQMSCQSEDYYDQQDQSEPSAGIVTPTGTVRPRRQRADQQKDQDDQ